MQTGKVWNATSCSTISHFYDFIMIFSTLPSRLGMFVLLIFFWISAAAQRVSPNAVTIGARQGTEMLHVEGTMRVETLPLDGERKLFNYTSSATQVFNPRYVVVTDKHGVLGIAKHSPQWIFYMPPILLPLCKEKAATGEYLNEGDATTDGRFRVDLYEHYRQQFGMSDATRQVRSNTAELPDKAVWEKSQLMFFVTYYDQDYFQDVTVSDAGVLTYRVKKNIDPSPRTYMNIVFRVKG